MLWLQGPWVSAHYHPQIKKKSDQIIDKLWFSPITGDNQSLHVNNLFSTKLFFTYIPIYLFIIPPRVCTMCTCMYRWAHACLLGCQREIYSITFSLTQETGSLKASQTMLMYSALYVSTSNLNPYLLLQEAFILIESSPWPINRIVKNYSQVVLYTSQFNAEDKSNIRMN